jgi:hypothetical protein
VVISKSIVLEKGKRNIVFKGKLSIISGSSGGSKKFQCRWIYWRGSLCGADSIWDLFGSSILTCHTAARVMSYICPYPAAAISGSTARWRRESCLNGIQSCTVHSYMRKDSPSEYRHLIYFSVIDFVRFFIEVTASTHRSLASVLSCISLSSLLT